MNLNTLYQDDALTALEWAGCYSDSWKDLITPESFSHPAKCSCGLLKRILAHAKEEGWLKPGDVVCDPFGGVGTTGILGAYEGHRVVCVELEARFVALAEQNFALHAAKWRILGCPQPIIIQGDSRRLCELVAGADCIVSSPPFLETTSDKPSKNILDGGLRMGQSSMGDGYGISPGQLGSMPPGKLADVIVSSPPYSGEGLGHQGAPSEIDLEKKLYGRINNAQYGQIPGNLGNLRQGDVAAIVSSPPYEGSMTAGGHLIAGHSQGRPHAESKGKDEIYGTAEGQLGNSQGETFWSAAKTIVEQCFQILRPGGYAIWVVKDFVRNKKRVDFTGDWRRLCESVGFKTLHEHHALLVKEERHNTLFGGQHVKRKERKSFFRRLAESKGSPRIDYEVVLCQQKPASP